LAPSGPNVPYDPCVCIIAPQMPLVPGKTFWPHDVTPGEGGRIGAVRNKVKAA